VLDTANAAPLNANKVVNHLLQPGADNFAVEVIPFAPGTVFPVHQRLIRDFAMPLMEGLLVHELATTGCREFLFVASPLPVVGGTGSPINPIAIL